APALATTTIAIASSSRTWRSWPSTTKPASAVTAGSSDINTPTTAAGSRRSATSSSEYGRTEEASATTSADPSSWGLASALPACITPARVSVSRSAIAACCREQLLAVRRRTNASRRSSLLLAAQDGKRFVLRRKSSGHEPHVPERVPVEADRFVEIRHGERHPRLGYLRRTLSETARVERGYRCFVRRRKNCAEGVGRGWWSRGVQAPLAVSRPARRDAHFPRSCDPGWRRPVIRQPG